MTELTKNEILSLKHLSDGKDHYDVPSSLTKAQYDTATKNLKVEHNMVRACTTGRGLAISIKPRGLAYLDDLKEKENIILKNILRQYGITQDQFSLLELAKEKGACDNIFGISGREYKELVWLDLYNNKYIMKKDLELVLTRLGEQLIEDIHQNVLGTITGETIDYPLPKMTNAAPSETANKAEKKVKYSGFSVSNDNITNAIKVFWAMNELGIFTDENGNRPDQKHLMDALAEFFHNDQFKQYSSYMSPSRIKQENTYVEIFDKLRDRLAKHFKEKNDRKTNQ